MQSRLCFVLIGLCSACFLLGSVSGCVLPIDPPNGNGPDNGNNGNGDNGDNDNGDNGDDDGDNGPGDGTVVGEYDPQTGLRLQLEGLELRLPLAVLNNPVTIALRRATGADLPAPLPDNVGFTGVVIEPRGLMPAFPGDVTLELDSSTPALVLPVVMFNTPLGRWVGTGDAADVLPDGSTVTFPVSRLDLVGVPDPVPLPPPGGPIGSLVSVTNAGTFTSAFIVSNVASLLFTDPPANLSINVVSQVIDNFANVEQRSLNLTSVAAVRSGNFVVAEIGGIGSSFSESALDPPEPIVGAVVMSITGQTVNAVVFVASQQRVISGIFTGSTS